MASEGSMRERMPKVAAWIDLMREAFGAEVIDQAIRDGLRGGTFRASENGYTVGGERGMESLMGGDQEQREE